MQRKLSLSVRNILLQIINKLYREIYRDPKRKKIAKTIINTLPSPPKEEICPFSVHTLICKRDLLMGICSAKSLNLMCKKALPWIFHDDGSLQQSDYQLLKYHFPGCQVIERSFIDNYLNAYQVKYPRSLELREKYKLMLKIIDVGILSDTDRILFVDTDILFFKMPVQLLKQLDQPNTSNYFNKDIETCYLYNPDDLEKFTNIRPPEKINSGLIIFQKSSINLEILENLIESIPLKSGLIYHRIEQTLFALLGSVSPFGVKHLDKAYDVELKKNIKEAVCKHYVGAIRHNFELEGLYYLIHELDFINRWNKFANAQS